MTQGRCWRDLTAADHGRRSARSGSSTPTAGPPRTRAGLSRLGGWTDRRRRGDPGQYPGRPGGRRRHVDLIRGGQRLVAGPAAHCPDGRRSGGRRRPRASVGRDAGRTGRRWLRRDDDRWIDLRVDDHTDPVLELRRLLDIWRLLSERPDPSDLEAIDPALAAELRARLTRAGWAPGRDDTFSASIRGALVGVSRIGSPGTPARTGTPRGTPRSSPGWASPTSRSGRRPPAESTPPSWSSSARRRTPS